MRIRTASFAPRLPSCRLERSRPLVELGALGVALSVSCASIVGIGDVPPGPPGGGLAFDAGADSGRPGEPDGGHPGGGDGGDGSAPGAEGGVEAGHGDGATGSAALLGYVPSNVTPTALKSLVLGDAFTTVPSDSCIAPTDPTGPLELGCSSEITAAMGVVVFDATGKPAAIVYALPSLTVASGSTLAISGPLPCILLVTGSVEIDGAIDVTLSGDLDGSATTPGEFASPGQGGFGAFTAGGAAGGAGASFCGKGGYGGAMTGQGTAPASAYGNPDLVPLVGGSAAAGDPSSETPLTFGGGAIQISSGQSIVVSATGVIDTNGTGADPSSPALGGGGGGSGGAILLEAKAVTVAGLLEANGGGGGGPNWYGESDLVDGTVTDPGNGGEPSGLPGKGDSKDGTNGGVTSADASAFGFGGGGGGAGRIRINAAAAPDTMNGVLSPSLVSGCATVGSLP